MELSQLVSSINKKPMRKFPEINSGSMADVAFTLLIFFLVSTTLAVDQGTKVLLPPYVPCETSDCSIDTFGPNVLAISILPNNKIQLEYSDFEMNQLKQEANVFLTNNGENPNYSRNIKDAIILLDLHPDAEYETYLEAMTIVRSAYNDLRNKEAIKRYGMKYEYLDANSAMAIREEIPMRMVEQLIEID